MRKRKPYARRLWQSTRICTVGTILKWQRALIIWRCCWSKGLVAAERSFRKLFYLILVVHALQQYLASVYNEASILLYRECMHIVIFLAGGIPYLPLLPLTSRLGVCVCDCRSDIARLSRCTKKLWPFAGDFSTQRAARWPSH